jgi:hypothetical protein
MFRPLTAEAKPMAAVAMNELRIFDVDGQYDSICKTAREQWTLTLSRVSEEQKLY